MIDTASGWLTRLALPGRRLQEEPELDPEAAEQAGEVVVLLFEGVLRSLGEMDFPGLKAVILSWWGLVGFVVVAAGLGLFQLWRRRARPDSPWGRRSRAVWVGAGTSFAFFALSTLSIGRQWEELAAVLDTASPWILLLNLVLVGVLWWRWGQRRDEASTAEGD